MTKNFEIVDGVYEGPKNYPGSLYLWVSAISDLGSMKSVGGWI